MSIKSVNLNNEIEILTKRTTRVSGGVYNETWRLYKKKFASIIYLRDVPQKDGNVLQFQNLLEIIIRYDKEILEMEKQDIRLKIGNVYAFVNSIIDKDLGKRYLNIWATENERARVTVND